MTRNDLFFGVKLLLVAVGANVLVSLLMDGNITSLISWKFVIAAITICTGAVFIRHFFKKLQKQSN